MSATLTFDHVLSYRYIFPHNTLLPAIVVGLIGPEGEEDVPAILDTGAAYCIFNGRRAPALGIDLLGGQTVRMASLGGELEGRLHRVTLEIEGVRFPCEVVFSLEHISRELLGRHSLFEQVTWGIRERYQRIYFQPQP